MNEIPDTIFIHTQFYTHTHNQELNTDFRFREKLKKPRKGLAENTDGTVFFAEYSTIKHYFFQCQW